MNINSSFEKRSSKPWDATILMERDYAMTLGREETEILKDWREASRRRA
jgi:hypothetical protein